MIFHVDVFLILKSKLSLVSELEQTIFQKIKNIATTVSIYILTLIICD
jgi:hypothetical protein